MLVLEIPETEYARRIAETRKLLEAEQLDAFCLFSSVRIFYLTGFAHIQTERPIALIVPRLDEVFAVIPALEQEHVAGRRGLIPHITVYPEYPGPKHPMCHLAEAMIERGLDQARLAVDSDGYGAIWGYQGPTLSSVLPQCSVVNRRAWLDELRMVKSPQEIALLRESARIGNLAHSILESLLQIGSPEIEITQTVAAQTTQVMLKMFGPQYTSKRWNASPAFAYLISGPRTGLPHGLPTGRKLQRGDIVITSCSGEVGGYMAELERTLFLGPPSSEQCKYFELMMQARDVAFQTIAPGRACSEVDLAVLEFFRSHGCSEWVRHHVGHALGLEPHEAPFLDQADRTVLRTGMVFSVEPGLYVKGLGGFRHSDTVVVTEAGAEAITYYPTDIDSLTVSA